MPRITSLPIEPDRWLYVAEHLVREYGADLYEFRRRSRDHSEAVLGLWPRAELVVGPATHPQEILDFCFRDDEMTGGYLSYPYGQLLHGVPVAPSPFPMGHLKKYEMTLYYTEGKGLEIPSNQKRLIAELRDVAEQGTPVRGDADGTSFRGTGLRESLDQAAYEEGVRQVLEHIRLGDTYQLNLSIKFSCQIRNPDGPGLFFFLRRKRPAPYYSWINSGPYSVLSTSPELFLQVEKGRVVSSPIKGTAPCGNDPRAAAERLGNSAKEDAELSMIVDLIRNDISCNCEYGTVRVKNHKSTFVVDTVVQMYSDVLGRLNEDRTCMHLLLDAFPGGSVTGCPKKRSMEIIGRLEPHSRDIYCGAVFLVFDERNLMSSIAIRSAWMETVDTMDTGGPDTMLHFYAGSGIVVDSDPGAEYLETLSKAEKFLELCGQ